MVYLDHAAATPLDDAVLTAMQPLMTAEFYNPSAPYLAARSVRLQLETAREKVAQWFGARPTEIIFTAGGTEANNIAVHGVMRLYPEAHMVMSAIEHDSVFRVGSSYKHTILPVLANGIVDVSSAAAAITDATVLVSCMYANNEVGTIQPVKELAEQVSLIRVDRRLRGVQVPLYLHVDACQAPLFLDLHAERLGADLVSINAGKIYGPRQVGALYARAGVQLQTVIFGGGQERGLRSGTENTAGAVGLAVALDRAQRQRKSEGKRLSDIRDQTIRQLVSQVPGGIVNGSQRSRLPSNIHFTIPGTDNERLMMELDERGFAVAVGSACSASSDEPSHVLRAMGISEQNAQASLRVTMGRSTSVDDMRAFVQALAECL